VQRLDEQSLSVNEREIIRWALRRGAESSFTPKETMGLLGISHSTAHKKLHRLLQAGFLVAASGTIRIRAYRLSPTAAKLHT